MTAAEEGGVTDGIVDSIPGVASWETRVGAVVCGRRVEGGIGIPCGSNDIEENAGGQ